MPYERKDKCVYKKSPNKKVGCSDTVAKAKKYIQALYTSELNESLPNIISPEEQAKIKEYMAAFIKDKQTWIDKYGLEQVNFVMYKTAVKKAKEEMEKTKETMDESKTNLLKELIKNALKNPEKADLRGAAMDKQVNEIGMFMDRGGYKKSEPNPKDLIFTKKFVGTSDTPGYSGYIYDIYKNGVKIKTIEGEGNANAYINQLQRDLEEGIDEYLGGIMDVPRNYGMDFDDDDENEDDKNEDYYDEDGNLIPLRSPLHPNNRNMEESREKLKEGYGMSLEDAMKQAYEESLNGYVQHVEDNGDGTFKVSDWYDSDMTIVSFEDGRKFNDRTSEYEMNEADSIKKRRAILPSKQKGIADEIPVVSMLDKIIQQAWAEPDLNKAKEMVLTYIQQSRINPRSKKTMAYNIETARTKPRLDQYLANALLSYEKMSVTEGANKAMEKAVKEIEKKSELAKAEAKLHQVEELISELENKLTMTEADGMSDMVDKKKVKEIKRNLKFLESKKKRYLSEKAKLGKKYGVKTMIEEEKADPTIEDEKMADKAMQSMRRDVAQPARAWSEVVKDILASKGVKK